MKTFEEFTQEIENNRIKRLRPGHPEYNSYNHYLGFLYENGKYTFLEGPRVRAERIDLIETANSLCDLLEEFPLRYELNFSEQVPKQEKEFLKRFAKIVLEKGRCKSSIKNFNKR